MHHTLHVDESPAARDLLGSSAPAPVRRVYLALTRLFKNGRTYEPGDPIALDPTTASHFLAAGEIKDSE